MAYALPELYDALYGYKDYAGEAARIRELVQERNPCARSLLDVACGTGRHLEQLRGDYAVEGLDVDEGLLAVARGRLDGIPLHKGDMRGFDLGSRFDVVTCLFSAIGHLETTAELDAAIATMTRHLEDGGVLLVEPWVTPEAWTSGKPALLTVDEPELKIARISMTGRRGTTSLLDFHYLVATPDGMRSLSEHMELGLFTRGETEAAFERAGLAVSYDEHGLIGRGLYIGIRRS
jgi:SAM-dependent methyltransferase